MDQPPKPPETMAERAERWAAESAQVAPRSRRRGPLGEVTLRVIAGVVALVLIAVVCGVVLLAREVAHRSRPGDHQSAGWITATTCFEDDPGTQFEDVELRMELPTVDCADPHRAEAFMSFDLAAPTADPSGECASEWARRSDVPPTVSGISLTYLTVGAIAETAICVAVGPEPVEGRELASWQP